MFCCRVQLWTDGHRWQQKPLEGLMMKGTPDLARCDYTPRCSYTTESRTAAAVLNITVNNTAIK